MSLGERESGGPGGCGVMSLERKRELQWWCYEFREREWRWSSSDDGGSHVLGGGSGLGQWLTGFILERERENETSSIIYIHVIFWFYLLNTI
ncbi:hypothetical protein HanIR_Chr05g0249601 [Helianthus annuus]|nr:hypothetical protein HanIR_Chr05g0249601 [Helianthus annuus]